MKLATVADGSRDGALGVVNRQGTRIQLVPHIAKTLQAALDGWDECAPRLDAAFRRLEERSKEGQELNPSALLAPLPRAYEWVDGSAFINHVRLVRKARGAEPPSTLETDPLVYQGGSSVLLGARSPFPLPDPAWGLDFEAEVCVVLGDVRRGTSAREAPSAIRLLMVGNDWSYRNLIPAELAKGFGFFNSKPATAFSPFALTPDELGNSWRNGRLHLPMRCYVNERKVGEPDAGVGMHFSFYDLIAHIAKTRDFAAGTILGSGTVSNADESVGVACLAEQRCRETIADGAPITPFLSAGDKVRIEMSNPRGENLFGTIDQEVVSA